MKELNFDFSKEKMISLISTTNQMSLATSYKERVTVRTIYVVCRDMSIYFLTRKSSTKYKQLLKNSNTGLCFDNIQIEGEAELLGHPRDEVNREIVDYCLEHGYDNFKHYMKYKNALLIEVKPKLIGCWTKSGREYLDLVKNSAYRVG